MNRIYRIVLVGAIIIISLAGCTQKQKTGFPSKNVYVYIFSSQGGGSDRWARHLSALMEKELKTHFVCNNLPGANGGSGAMRVWNSPRDGYSLLGGSETALFFGVNDVAPTAENWEFFVAAGSPGVIAVHKDSPYSDFASFMQAAQENPRQVKVANSGNGKLWHIKAAQLEKGADVKFQHIPYNGSAPAIIALLSKEVDAVSCSASEILEYVRSGLVRPLAMTEVEPMSFEGFGRVPSVTEFYPDIREEFENLYQWLGFLIPSDVPSDALAIYQSAFINAMNHPKTLEMIETYKLRKMALYGQEAKTRMIEMQRVASWMSNDLGLAKKHPHELNITRVSD